MNGRFQGVWRWDSKDELLVPNVNACAGTETGGISGTAIFQGSNAEELGGSNGEAKGETLAAG